MRTVAIEAARQYYYERETRQHKQREAERHQWLQDVMPRTLMQHFCRDSPMRFTTWEIWHGQSKWSNLR